MAGYQPGTSCMPSADVGRMTEGAADANMPTSAALGY
jgi:hypothetical protein